MTDPDDEKLTKASTYSDPVGGFQTQGGVGKEGISPNPWTDGALTAEVWEGLPIRTSDEGLGILNVLVDDWKVWKSCLKANSTRKKVEVDGFLLEGGTGTRLSDVDVKTDILRIHRGQEK